MFTEKCNVPTVHLYVIMSQSTIGENRCMTGAIRCFQLT